MCCSKLASLLNSSKRPVVFCPKCTAARPCATCAATAGLLRMFGRLGGFLVFRRNSGLFLILVPLVKRKAGSAERMIAQFAVLSMGIAHGNTAIGTRCYSVPAARIAESILNARYLDNSALHDLAFYFD